MNTRPRQWVVARHAPVQQRSWFAVVWTCGWGGLTLSMLFVAAAQWTGLDPAPDTEAALGAVMVALFTGFVAVAGVIMSRARRGREPVPGLADAETELVSLLDQLAPREVLDSVLDGVEDTAGVAAARIRVVAVMADAYERAAEHAPPGERTTLQDKAAGLRGRLDQAIDAYGGLVAAAGHVLRTGTTAFDDELLASADNLASASEALCEVSPPDR